ncbi:UDP-N-acetylmuramoyl-L-alanine--D-glutamate ligase [Paraglaciecola sp. L3A3]|uniref:UDP-N-acetylmuramoyl-L-alanine--D-glutamate ligase n=1 Tax=Paraglaciecola sp. L3A3 TaxID=2686358 RepID=UPI00131BF933|nr:UDP-N-acetylmuramoyl-L-alanine--D-glutamate ligase [Paraglaciecola sp. L3A3]
MTSLDLVNKNIVVLGMGLTGLSCVRFLLAKKAKVVAMDSRNKLTVDLDVPVFLGEFDPAILCEADLIVASPGINLNSSAIYQAIDHGVKVIGDIELFAHFNTVPVIAITGSNGKSTVTHLVVEMCQAAGKKALMGGNIGVPVLELLDQEADIIVLELSSFQLDTTYSLAPFAATVLNVSEDHLDRHGSLFNYQQAKLKIFDNAQFSVFNRDDKFAQTSHVHADTTFGLSFNDIGWSWDKTNECILYLGFPFLNSADCLLVGEHNMLNIQAAAALCLLAGIDKGSIKQGATTFAGLEHRCQTVSIQQNIRWINDSKATNVGATLAAIKGLHKNCQGKLVLIAGGEGKGADFSPLQTCLQQDVSVLITLGKDGDKIAALKENSMAVASIEDAVTVASQLVEAGDIVLLSPACASLDMFANYQERGNCFVHAVQRIVT